jgi:hypothetical protein
LKINLLGQTVSDPETPMGVAILSAIAKFEDQRRKAGLATSDVRDAWLTLRRLPSVVCRPINGHHSCAGFHLSVVAAATMDDGKRYERDRVVFVAPHDPKVELRSAPFVDRSCTLRSIFEEGHEQLQKGGGIPNDQFWREVAQTRRAKRRVAGKDFGDKAD